MNRFKKSFSPHLKSVFCTSENFKRNGEKKSLGVADKSKSIYQKKDFLSIKLQHYIFLVDVQCNAWEYKSKTVIYKTKFSIS